MKKQTFVVNHGTYPFDVLVCIGTTHAEVTSVLGKKLGRELDDEESDRLLMRGQGRTVILRGGETVLRIDILKTRSEFHAILAHEIFHCVEMLFDRIDLKHDISCGEAFAYQIAHITRQIYEKI